MDNINNNDISGNRQYKDSVFTKLFGEKDKLAELYNAIAGTSYEPDDITLANLENIIFIGRENDIAFTVDNKLIVLVEHQSSINPNMPLRFLLYIAREYQMFTDNEAIYSSRLIKIMPPEFIVIYNGKDDYPEEATLNLSDAFISKVDNLELKARVYNINKGNNLDIMSRSKTLNGYSIFVSRARENMENGFTTKEALTKAVKDCIRDNILSEFLKIYGSDVINMLSMEFNLDDALKVREKDGREKAKEEIAENFLRDGISKEIVIKNTGLSSERVDQLMNKIKSENNFARA